MVEKKKIVVIDDELDLCAMVKENLEETGAFKVAVTAQSTEANALVLKEKPDLILLDIVMPEVHGPALVALFKKNPKTASIPIVVISGRGEMVYLQKKDKWQWLPNRKVVLEYDGEIIKEKDPQVAAAACEIT